MSTLTPLQRASVMVVRDQKLLGMLRDMILRGRYEEMGYYWNSGDEKIYMRDIFRYKDKGRYTMAQIKNAEKEILKNVLVFRETEEITFRRPFVNKYETLLQYISTMTNDMMFTFTYSLLDEPGVRNSLWFRER